MQAISANLLVKIQIRAIETKQQIQTTVSGKPLVPSRRVRQNLTPAKNCIGRRNTKRHDVFRPDLRLCLSSQIRIVIRRNYVTNLIHYYRICETTDAVRTLLQERDLLFKLLVGNPVVITLEQRYILTPANG